MTDVFTERKRSAVMTAIRAKGNKATELRLIGLMRGSLMLVPIFQAAMVALMGALAAAGTALAGSIVLNRASLIDTANSSHPLCVIQSWHLATAAAISIAGAILAAGFAGRRAAAIQPAEGLANA